MQLNLLFQNFLCTIFNKFISFNSVLLNSYLALKFPTSTFVIFISYVTLVDLLSTYKKDILKKCLNKIIVI